LSFAIIAQHKYQTTPELKGFAAKCVAIILKDHVRGMKPDQEGFIASEGMRVKYEDAKVLHTMIERFLHGNPNTRKIFQQIIPEQMVDNITQNYMSFITRLKNSHSGGDGNVATKAPPGNSSEQGSYNASMKTANPPSEPREISYIAYIGITLSMIGLFITMTSICYFR
jgi:hypothetical protein